MTKDPSGIIDKTLLAENLIFVVGKDPPSEAQTYLAGFLGDKQSMASQKLIKGQKSDRETLDQSRHGENKKSKFILEAEYEKSCRNGNFDVGDGHTGLKINPLDFVTL